MVSLHMRASREKGGTALCFKGSNLKRIPFFKFLSRRETLADRGNSSVFPSVFDFMPNKIGGDLHAQPMEKA